MVAKILRRAWHCMQLKFSHSEIMLLKKLAREAGDRHASTHVKNVITRYMIAYNTKNKDL